MSTPAALIETHISVVTLIGDRAYKLMKPVSLAFLDHRRRCDRHDACRRETEVNRRFAPDVYLGVLDVVDEQGIPRDHLIAMRRMPPGRRLSGLLDDPRAPEYVRSVARAVAGFHREAPSSHGISEAGTIGAVLGLWEEGLDQLAAIVPPAVPAEELERARALARDYLEGRRALLERRIAVGRVRDGHGDLLADDIFCLSDGPRVLDALAFDDRLRHGDVLGDICFLAMDLEARGHPGLAALLLDTWGEDLGEDHPASLAHHYIAYRAHVRAKIAALRAADGEPGAAERARSLHALTLDHLERAQVRLVLVGGAPGTGKSTLAEGVAAAEGWRLLSSDAVRKNLLGRPLTPGEPGGFQTGIYATGVSDTVYARMLEAAADLLAMGESVVLDASWGAEDRRCEARRVAAAARARCDEIECRLPAARAAARILKRRSAGQGASDATPEIAARLRAAADPWPLARAIATDAPPAQVLERALVSLASPSRVGR